MTVWAVGLLGCASPGVPRPPSLHLPATVTDLSASRIGDHVVLRWTAPTRTTDGLDLAEPSAAPTTAEICRDLPPGSRRGNTLAGYSPDPTCTSVLRVTERAGISSADDLIPPGLTAEAARGSAIAYRVRVLNGSGRSAAASASVLVPGGPAVRPVEAFRATQTKDGVLLAWRGGDDAEVEVVRTVVPAAASGVSHPVRAAEGALGRGRRAETNPEVRMRADAGGSGTAAAGMLDATALADSTYLYRAERVRTIQLGPERVVMRSEATQPVQVTLRDTFAPEPPRGLASIPGSATASSGPKLTIDLSWEPNTETDLAGYFVYRVDLGPGSRDATPRRLTSAAVSGPAFRDREVVVGERYQYRVSAVDQRGNESKPSEPVTDSPAIAQ